MTSERLLVVAVEATAALGPYWNAIRADYLDKIVRTFHGNEMASQKLPCSSAEFALVVFHTHGPYSAFGVQRSGWTKHVDMFFRWLSSIPFSGGGFSEAAIAEGLSEALMMLPVNSNGSQNLDCQKHCILVAASNPYPLPTPVRKFPSLEKNENSDVRPIVLCDAETVAKCFSQSTFSLSVLSPKQLPKLRDIYNAGKRNPATSDPTVDQTKNPHFLVLVSDGFVEARNALSPPGVVSLQSNQVPIKVDGLPRQLTTPVSSPPAPIATANGSMINRQAVPIANAPAVTVKMEPTNLSSAVSAPAFSHIPPTSNTLSQGISTLPTSSPPPASQEVNGSVDPATEFKPLVNAMTQTVRPAGPAAANVNILNNLSQARVTPMAMHMSNMISNGMSSSVLSGMTSISGSGALVATTQATQSTGMGSLASTNSNISGNTSVGLSSSLTNLQGNVGMGQLLAGSGQASISSGSQIGQTGITTNQNVMNGMGVSTVASGGGTMIPTPGMSQQTQTGMSSLAAPHGSTMSIPSQQNAGTQQPQSKYVKIWEGALSGQRQGQPVFICKLEGYRSSTASEKLADDWPSAMQIVRLIAQDHMNNKQYVGKADLLVFRPLNPHGFLGQLQDKKLCAVIQLPSQTLLLSVTDKTSRLIGMLFPGDMVVFKPQVSTQQQQLFQHQQLQQQQQQQQQAQQPQRPQMVSAALNQTFSQGPGRSQMMPQGMMPQQGPGNMSGGNFMH